MPDGTFNGSANLTGTIKVGAGSITNTEVADGAEIVRTKLAQESLVKYIVPFKSMVVWNAIQTSLPSPSAADDLGFPATQTFGTVTPYLDTYDLKTLTQTLYARFRYPLPVEYSNGQTIKLRIRAGMKTTIADTSCDADLECHLADRDGGAGSDICTTLPKDMNNLTNADLDFVITETGLVSGNVLDCRIAVICVDGSGGAAVIGEILEVAFLLDIRG